MEITKELLKKEFEKYNKMYFDNKLEMCEFHYHYINMFGRYSTTIKNNKIIGHIWITKKTDWDEKKLKQIMVHEMIHHYVHTVQGIKFDGLFQHGRQFVKQIKRIKKQHNYEVLVCFPNWKFKKEKDNHEGKIFLKTMNILRNKMHLF